MMGDVVRTAPEIHVGDHVTFDLFGLTFNADTIWSTLVAGAIVIGLGFWMRSKVSSGVPSKVQLAWEGLVNEVTTQVEVNLGRVNPFVVPLAIALFTFILIANWLEIIPTGDKLRSPTADVNVTYPLALLVIIGVHVYGIRERGIKRYVKHFFEPLPIMFPLNVIEEIVKPFTLALRLFGNIFASGIMISLIALLPIYTIWGPNVIWKLFAMFIGAIQAFIFALLTVLYFGMAGSHDSAHTDEHDSGDEHESTSAQHDQPEPQPQLAAAG